jgi:enamine deaminase RidA (YjgF/YER057c/UK114 family)
MHDRKEPTMTDAIDQRLADLGIELPEPAKPAAAYVPYTLAGNLLHVSGQLPTWNGDIRHIGKLGATCSIDDGAAAARLCALNILAQVKAACDGRLSRVKRCLALTGLVNATADFADHPKVVNGASLLMVEVFGDAGRHARTAFGAASLPFGVAVEVNAVFELS